MARGRPQTGGALRQGTVLEGRYEIQRICGQGGMSTVYAARDLRFTHVERLCAVKEMFLRANSEQARATQIANFEREASLLATLSHPAIPKIYDYFFSGGLIYLVLEFIEGEDLERLISRSAEPIAEDTLVSWALQILDVLAYLHEHEPEPIVFRDLKPSNIMLRDDGSISLIDFGIARTFQPLRRGTMIGTEGYAPPEQYRGIAEPRGDIYALGATLHHLATRSDPRSEPPFTFDQRPVRQLNPRMSEGFERIVHRALAYLPADRFPSAAAMAQELLSLRQEIGGAQSAAGAPLPHWLPDPQAPTTSSMTASGPAVAALAPPTEEVAERVLWSVQTADEVRGSAAAASGCVYIGSYDHHLYALNVRDGGILWRYRTNRGVVSRPLVAGTNVVFGSEDHSVYALSAGSGRMAWSFRTAMPIRSSAVLYQDAVIIGSDDGYCYCLDAHQGSLLWRQRAWGPVRSTPLVAGDTVVVGCDDGSVYAFSALDGRARWRAPLGRPVLSSPIAVGDVVVVGCTDGKVYGLDLRTGARRWTVETQGPIIASPRAAGDAVYIGSTDGAVYAVSAHSGTVEWKQQVANQVTGTMTIDGARGYLGTVDGNVVCLSLDDGETVWSHKVGGPIVSTPCVSAGIVVVGSLDGRIYGLRA